MCCCCCAVWTTVVRRVSSSSCSQGNCSTRTTVCLSTPPTIRTPSRSAPSPCLLKTPTNGELVACCLIMMMMIIASGDSNLTERQHVRCTWMVHSRASLSPTEAMPQRHLLRFSCFCTADGRQSLYFTMGLPFPPQNPIHMRDLDSTI